MKFLLGIGSALLLKIVLFQKPVMNFINSKTNTSIVRSDESFKLSSIDLLTIKIFFLVSFVVLACIWLYKKWKKQSNTVLTLGSNTF